MLRIVFMGTPDFSVPTLAEILGAGHDVVAVYSQPPRKSGRGMGENKTPVHQYAEAAGVPVFTPISLRTDDAAEQFAAHQADIAVVVAYGLILPKPILDAPRHGCLNLHASKLPRWRGAAPIQRAIMAGDTETASMVMRMEEGLDTGPICLAELVAIGPNTTAGELHGQLSRGGASLMVRALAAVERDSLDFTPQPDEGVTYAKKIEKTETRINFFRPAQDVHNHIRGLSPFPGAWFAPPQTGAKDRIKVLRTEITDSSNTQLAAPGTLLDDNITVACASGAVRFIQLQRSGKKPMMADEFLRGFDLPQGAKLL